jgi:hypothetical protein
MAGSGGTKVIITGTDLQGTSNLTFGASPAQSYAVNAAGTRITAYAPQESAGTVGIQITTPGGASSTGNTDDQFTYP